MKHLFLKTKFLLALIVSLMIANQPIYSQVPSKKLIHTFLGSQYNDNMYIDLRENNDTKMYNGNRKPNTFYANGHLQYENLLLYKVISKNSATLELIGAKTQDIYAVANYYEEVPLYDINGESTNQMIKKYNTVKCNLENHTNYGVRELYKFEDTMMPLQLKTDIKKYKTEYVSWYDSNYLFAIGDKENTGYDKKSGRTLYDHNSEYDIKFHGYNFKSFKDWKTCIDNLLKLGKIHIRKTTENVYETWYNSLPKYE